MRRDGAPIAAAFGAMLAAFGVAAPAKAATATFVSPVVMDPASLQALGTSGDGQGLLLGLTETLALLFSTPFAGVQNADSVSIFTLAPTVGKARVTISFGVYNGGSPTIVMSRTINAGSALTTSSLFQQGCSVFGGCDYIEITTTRTTKGAAGAQVDYVSVNGETVEIAAPAPEPATWALMILCFIAVAGRLKRLRAREPRHDFALARAI